MAPDLLLRIAARREEADGIVGLDLVAAEGGALPRFSAGSHIDIEIAPGLTRAYSLCGDPARTDTWQLAVLREEASRGGSAAVHRDFHPGRVVRAAGPRNHFPLREDASFSLLLAGGIGITPLLAMAWRLHALGRRFCLHLCARRPSRAAFLPLLTGGPLATHARVHFDAGDPAQRFQPDAILRPPGPDGDLYVCGPGGFMDGVIAAARQAGWAEGRIHQERFSAPAAPAGGTTFTVIARRSGRRVTVPPDRSIADMLLEAGIDLPLSCEQGVCGSCLTDVIAGIPDHRDLYQTDEEKAANRRITPCCSRALSAELELDI
ncbi:MAG: PDR/VanB family oxidoreductase [Acetobacteraceae bacterium]